MQTQIPTIDNCRLVQSGSFAEAALILAYGFERLESRDGWTLLRAPADFEIAQERDGELQ